MDADFPAAHSMDTLWFAVDRDGHVAAFQSGEAGAVPVDAHAGTEAQATRDRLRELLPAGGIIHDLAGRALPGQLGGRIPDDVYALFGLPVLVFLTSLEPARAALAAGRATEARVTDGVAVIVRGITNEELEAYRAAPEFRGCVTLYDYGEQGENSLAERGLYEYRHLTENWISGPYGRESLPVRPLHVDQLPPDLRNELAPFRLDVRFADVPHLQPVELTACESWEAAYLDATGSHVRPIPGKEDDYPEAYADLASFGNQAGFEVEPPAQSEEKP